ncbi:MAG TPA: hypothetical protein DCZ10_15820 [Pelotomaculum sp.]|nr:hypothetical protein [Pelotomaculum sp.]
MDTILSMFDPAVLIGLKVAFFAILGDAALGWLFAFSQGSFDIREVPRFLRTNLLPYMGALVITALLSLLGDDYKAVFFVVTAIVTAKFGVEALKDKLVRYFKPTSEP